MRLLALAVKPAAASPPVVGLAVPRLVAPRPVRARRAPTPRAPTRRAQPTHRRIRGRAGFPLQPHPALLQAARWAAQLTHRPLPGRRPASAAMVPQMRYQAQTPRPAVRMPALRPMLRPAFPAAVYRPERLPGLAARSAAPARSGRRQAPLPAWLWVAMVRPVRPPAPPRPALTPIAAASP